MKLYNPGQEFSQQYKPEGKQLTWYGHKQRISEGRLLVPQWQPQEKKKLGKRKPMESSNQKSYEIWTVDRQKIMEPRDRQRGKTDV